MICSAQSIRRLKLLVPCREPYKDSLGNSAGLSACGYDLTATADLEVKPQAFILASAAEKFDPALILL
jgi:hypothetical protein